MGLDSVILLQEVEEHFGIAIPDEEAEQINTVGDFAKCVFRHITPQVAIKCKTQIVFYEIRENLSNELLFNKSLITLQSVLKDLIPFSKRLEVWKKLEILFEVKLPKLVKDDIEEEVGKKNWFFGLKDIYSREGVLNHTAGDLTNWILSLKYNKYFEVDGLCNLKEIEKVMIGFIADKLSVPIEEVKLASSITNDLGID